MSSASSSLTWNEGDSGTGIEAGDFDDFEDDEFTPSDLDVESLSSFGSITSSVLRHSYENGRRVCCFGRNQLFNKLTILRIL
jgi:hypothetical protein